MATEQSLKDNKAIKILIGVFYSTPLVQSSISGIAASELSLNLDFISTDKDVGALPAAAAGTAAGIEEASTKAAKAAEAVEPTAEAVEPTAEVVSVTAIAEANAKILELNEQKGRRSSDASDAKEKIDKIDAYIRLYENQKEAAGNIEEIFRINAVVKKYDCEFIKTQSVITCANYHSHRMKKDVNPDAFISYNISNTIVIIFSNNPTDKDKVNYSQNDKMQKKRFLEEDREAIEESYYSSIYQMFDGIKKDDVFEIFNNLQHI